MAINLGSAVAYLKLDNSDFNTSLDSSESKLSGVGRRLGAGIAVAATAVASGLAAIGKSSVDTGMQFDKSMSQVAATLGTTVGEIQNLKDFAMEMGASTVFSATQAADALNYMALAGYDVEKSMEMLPTVLNLAAAGNMDLARASDMVTDAESALNLKTGQAAKMVDQMAKTASRSNTSVEQLGDAILTIGGTATLMAGGTDRLATVLGILADNGIKGSEAGTHLRNMLLRLSSPTKEGIASMQRLGLEIFDSSGNMRDMEDIIFDLSDAMSDLTDEEKIKHISAMFNSRDIAAVNALLNTSKTRWQELGAAIVDSKDAASEMAETQLDNLAGDVTLLKSAFEGAQITISNKLTPTLRKFVQFGTKEIGKLDKAFQQGGIKGFADQLGKSLGDGISVIAGYIPKAIEVVGTFISSVTTSIVDSLPNIVVKITRSAPKMLTSIGESFEKSFPSFVGSLGETLGVLLGSAPQIISAGFKLVKGLVKGALDAVPELISGLVRGFEMGMSESKDSVSIYVQGIKDELSTIPSALSLVDDALTDINAKQAEAEHWINIFERLSEKENPTIQDTQNLKIAVDELNKLFPELDLTLDENTGKWSLNTKEIKDNIEAMQDRARKQAYIDASGALYKEIAALELKRQKEKDAARAAQDHKTAIEQSYGPIMDLRDSLLDLDISYKRGEISGEEFKSALQELIPDGTVTTLAELNEYTSELDKQLRNFDEPLAEVSRAYDEASAAVAEYDRKIGELQSDIDWLYEQAGIRTGKAVDDMVKAYEKGKRPAADSGVSTADSYVDGMIGRIDASEGRVSSAAKRLAQAALSVFDKNFSSGVGGRAGNNRSIASYATGLSYVPKTMDVTVHRGERILTQEENKRYNEGGSIEITTYQGHDKEAINDLGTKLDRILEAIDNFEGWQIVMDGKRLVGSIRKEINRQLADEYAMA